MTITQVCVSYSILFVQSLEQFASSMNIPQQNDPTRYDSYSYLQLVNGASWLLCYNFIYTAHIHVGCFFSTTVYCILLSHGVPAADDKIISCIFLMYLYYTVLFIQ